MLSEVQRNSPYTVTIISFLSSLKLVPSCSPNWVIRQIYSAVSVSWTGLINIEPLDRRVKRGSCSNLTRLKSLYQSKVGLGNPSAEQRIICDFPTKRSWFAGNSVTKTGKNKSRLNSFLGAGFWISCNRLFRTFGQPVTLWLPDQHCLNQTLGTAIQ